MLLRNRAFADGGLMSDIGYNFYEPDYLVFMDWNDEEEIYEETIAENPNKKYEFNNEDGFWYEVVKK